MQVCGCPVPVWTGGVWSGLTGAVRLLAAVVLLGCLLLIVVLVGQGVAAAAELVPPDAKLPERGLATPPPALAVGGDTASPRGGVPAHRGRGASTTVPQVLALLPDPRLRVATAPEARREGDGDGDPQGAGDVTLAAATRQAPASVTPAAPQVAGTSPKAPIAGIVNPVMTSGRDLAGTITASTAGLGWTCGRGGSPTWRGWRSASRPTRRPPRCRSFSGSPTRPVPVRSPASRTSSSSPASLRTTSSVSWSCKAPTSTTPSTWRTWAPRAQVNPLTSRRLREGRHRRSPAPPPVASRSVCAQMSRASPAG